MLTILVSETVSPVVGRFISEAGQGFPGAMREIGEAAVRSVHINFEVGGRPRWVPLSPATVARKGNSRPLIQTGAMMNSIGYEIGYDGLSVYASDWKAPIHQYGQGRIPARPFLVLQSEDAVNFASILRAHIGRIL